MELTGRAGEKARAGGLGPAGRRYLGCLLGLTAAMLGGLGVWLAAQGGIAELELLRTFNCGIGMIAIVKAEAVDAVKAVLTESGEHVALLGEVVPAVGDQRVIYNGALDLSL